MRTTRITVQKSESGGKAAGKQHPLSGREAETEGEPGQKPYRQGECDEGLQVSGLCIRQRKGWTVHSCPSQSPAESEEQAARNHEAKPRSQRPKGHAGNKGLHDRMAELLRDSVPKDENAGMGRMAAAPNPCIHLEAMEETEDQTQEPHEARCAGILRTYGRQQPQRLLVYGERGSRDKRHNKRKTHTRGIL